MLYSDETPDYLLPQMGDIPVTEPAVFRSLFIIDTVDGYLGYSESPDEIERNIERITEELGPLKQGADVAQGFWHMVDVFNVTVPPGQMPVQSGPERTDWVISVREGWNKRREQFKDYPGVLDHIAEWPEGNLTNELIESAKKVAGGAFSWRNEFFAKITDLTEKLNKEISKRGTAEVTDALDPFADSNQALQRKPAVGVLTTHHQGWMQKGLALGNLLHSVCLAPGEVTQVAVVDWQRRTRGTSAEQTEQGETVTSSIEQTRAVNEVQNAVAEEAQTGGSSTSATSATTQAGASFGTLSFGASVASATSATSALTAQFSSGSRNIAAESSNALTQSTAEKSQSLRSRRAAVVREVSEQESETTTARVLANYNRRHTLNIEYFEVLQLYQIKTELAGWERCLFLPLVPIDFSVSENIDKHKATILRIFQEIGEGDRIAEFLGDRWLNSKLAAENGQRSAEEISRRKDEINVALNELQLQKETVEKQQQDLRQMTGLINLYDGSSKKSLSLAMAWNKTCDKLPSPLKEQIKRYEGGQGENWRPALLAAAIDSGRTLMAKLETERTNIRTKVREKTAELKGLTEENLKQAVPTEDILQANRLALSQQIWLRMDPYLVYRMLKDKTIAGRKISTLVDPHPVGVFGNFVAFRWGFDRSDAGAHQRTEFAWTYLNRDPEEQMPISVALPTSGVFAEAVLGRGEAAETLDETKFWRWDASPIPILPPKIAEIASRDRAKGADLSTSDFAAALAALRAQNPNDVSHLGAILGAVGKGDMFRNMGGLAETASLAEKLSSLSAAGATAAGAQAAEIQSKMMDTFVEILDSDVGKAVVGEFLLPGAGPLLMKGASDNNPVSPDGDGKGSSPIDTLTDIVNTGTSDV